MKRFSAIAIPLICLIFLSSGCRNEQNGSQDSALPASNRDTLDEYLEYANQALVENEEKKIAQFLHRHGWDLSVTPSGLRYKIYEPGKGSVAAPGDQVMLNYSVKSLNGIELISSSTEGPLTLIVERSEAINGLHELIQLMNAGAKARAVIPARLGYGFTGDQKRIPKGATLVYDIEVISIKDNK